MAVKDKTCKHCELAFCNNSDWEDYSFCRRAPCVRARSVYLKENFHLMGPSKQKTHYEDEFYKVNETQKKHYATFFALMRPKRKTMAKGRKCLKCQVSMSYQTEHNDHHICADCHRSNKQFGYRAEAI